VTADEDAVRRVDVGAGIYVRAPGTGSPSRRVPPLALAAGAALGAVALVRDGTGPRGVLAAALLVVLAALAAVDLRARVLPNRIVWPAIAGTLAWQLAFFGDRWAEWLIAGAGAAALMLLPSLVRPGAVGMGDVKLAILLGVALGADVLTALTVGFVGGAVAAAAMLVRQGGAARGGAIPYGPFLALGAAVVLLA
jgi:leader peptidase (prepilin peptidase)/N-methyltransferase